MRKILFASLCLLALIPTACTSKFSGPTTPLTSAPIAQSPTPTMGVCGLANGTPAQAVNLFSGDLYAAYQPQSGNIFFSPFSILTAMSMSQEGAVGPTACQMQTAMHLNSVALARRQGFQQLVGEINSTSKHYTLDTADNLWLQQGFPFLPAYINIAQTYYDAGVTSVDFKNNPAGALQTINGAVSQETGGYIPSLLAPSNISSITKLVLTNAVYFKGSWQYQFPVTDTNQQSFNLGTGAAETVSMMHLTLSANLGTFNGTANVLALPYANNEASLYIFLPPTGGMAALESAMTGANISSWLGSNSSMMTASGGLEVALSFPKFTFKTNDVLTASLSQMGMPLAFTPPIPGSGADFSGIDGTNDLYITDVVHQAYVDVSETGTTAAAATGVVMGCPMCLYVSTPIIIPFTVDHPFIFMLVENTSNVVLFMGRVNDPLATN